MARPGDSPYWKLVFALLIALFLYVVFSKSRFALTGFKVQESTERASLTVSGDHHDRRSPSQVRP